MIVAKEGLAGTYKGITPTIMKQGSNQAIRWDIVKGGGERGLTSRQSWTFKGKFLNPSCSYLFAVFSLLVGSFSSGRIFFAKNIGFYGFPTLSMIKENLIQF